jgi:hypothetical protein
MMLKWKFKSHSNEYGEGNYHIDKNDGSNNVLQRIINQRQHHPMDMPNWTKKLKLILRPMEMLLLILFM